MAALLTKYIVDVLKYSCQCCYNVLVPLTCSQIYEKGHFDRLDYSVGLGGGGCVYTSTHLDMSEFVCVCVCV